MGSRQNSPVNSSSYIHEQFARHYTDETPTGENRVFPANILGIGKLTHLGVLGNVYISGHCNANI